MRRTVSLFSIPLFVGVLIAGLMPGAPARALPAVIEFDAAGYQNTNSSASRTLGWIFTALDDIRVTQLGVWDHAADGLVADHLVGIWDAGGTLLGSVIVQQGAASPMIGAPTGGGRFRYEPVAGFVLDAGATYTIGSLYDSDDIFDFYPLDVDTSAAIAYGEERFGELGAGFVFPTDTFNRWGLFGPNFRYALVTAPASAVLFLTGLVALAGLAWRGGRQRGAAAS